jgi:DNA polymerase I
MSILLVDSTNNFVRNYVVAPYINGDGDPNGAVVGFLKSLRSFIEVAKPTKVFLIWDGPGGSKKRKAILPEYKEGRKPYRLNRNYDFEHVNVEENKIRQRLRLDEFLRDLPVVQIMIEDIEADDVIAYLVHHYPEERKVIVSNDRDFYQLLDEKTIVYLPTKKIFVTRKTCKEIYGVHTHNFAVFRAIIGDKSDNLSGVPGIGEKRVLKYFPCLMEEAEVTLDKLFEICETDPEKYKRFLDHREVIINNLKVMQLKNPIISFQSIQKIKDAIEAKPALNSTAFRVKLSADGIASIGENYFHSFKHLVTK